MSSTVQTLGALLRGVRNREGWTLKQMSEKSGIPVSTLSKVEHDRLTLTYDKLYQVAQRLGMRMSELFAESTEEPPAAITARRSLCDIDHAVRVETNNYDYYYLCTDLRRKRMIPVISKIRAKTSEEFGELVHHAGQPAVQLRQDLPLVEDRDDEGQLRIHAHRGGTVPHVVHAHPIGPLTALR